MKHGIPNNVLSRCISSREGKEETGDDRTLGRSYGLLECSLVWGTSTRVAEAVQSVAAQLTPKRGDNPLPQRSEHMMVVSSGGVTVTVCSENFVSIECELGDSTYIPWHDLSHHSEVVKWIGDFVHLVAQSASSELNLTTSCPSSSLPSFLRSTLTKEFPCQNSVKN